jgi:hypothetical protein
VPEKSTHQIDLIVADTLDYPTLLRVGGTAVVLPPAVRALIEVKSDLAKGADFVHAVAQICRIKQMLGLGEPVFTTLFSFTAPSRASTLRGWLEELMMLRRSLSGENVPEVNDLREEVLGDEQKVPHAAAELLAVLSADNLPDMVVADRGAVARKTKELDPLRDFYSFLKDRDDTPAVAVFIDQLLQYLSATAERTVAFPGAGSHKLAMELVRAQFGVKLEAFDGDRIEIPQLGPTVSSWGRHHVRRRGQRQDEVRWEGRFDRCSDPRRALHERGARASGQHRVDGARRRAPVLFSGRRRAVGLSRDPSREGARPRRSE